MHTEFGQTDPLLQLRLEQPEHAAVQALSEESAERLLDLLLMLPNGPIKHSAEEPGRVETSNNVARVRQAGPGMIEVLCLTRSSLKSTLQNMHDLIGRVAKRMTGTMRPGQTYSGWQPDRSSALVALAEEVFQKMEHRTPQIASAHSFLECGVIGEKLPGVDMISIGPDIVGTDGPGEQVRIESVEQTWMLLLGVLKELAKGTGYRDHVEL